MHYNLYYGDALQIIEGLKRKAKAVRWHNNRRMEFFGVAAQEIEGKERLREEGDKAIDFDDLEKIMK